MRAVRLANPKRITISDADPAQLRAFVCCTGSCSGSEPAPATCDEATRTAESGCKDTNGCVGCSDFNFGDDCDSNTREHCAEIECCAVCEAEIRAMFACEHGASCGAEFTCSSEPAPAPPAVTNAVSDKRLLGPRLSRVFDERALSRKIMLRLTVAARRRLRRRCVRRVACTPPAPSRYSPGC